MLLKHHTLNEHEKRLIGMSRSEFDEYMMSKYPDMFKNRYIQKDQEIILPMNFGFEIGPGWRHVIDSLCSKLKVIQDLTGLVCIFDQIKEKFGGARFYYHTEQIKDNGDKESIQVKEICRIIDDLVSGHEEYCDYVCEELGTNIDPKEKIVLGRWYYGMGIEGFKKSEEERGFGDGADRIKMAEEYVACRKKIEDIASDLSEFDKEGLEEIEKLVNQIIQRKKS